MAHAIDLDNLSIDELRKLACRIERRILSLSDDTAAQTAKSSPANNRPVPGVADLGPAQHGMAPGVNPEIRATLSEKVQDLIHTNDPWEGSGVGPTKWSLPFYGGHIVRTPEVDERFPGTQCGPALLPVFGGPPCMDTGVKPSRTPPAHVTATAGSSQRRQHVTCLQLCAICYSPCCMGGISHGLHACERHRLS